jgi:molybdenum cofactor biosynthesis enzyme MoaA
MMASGLKDVEFYVLNTDVQALNASPVPNKLAIGCKVTHGRGAGADPEVGKQAAFEDTERIIEILQGADMVFVTAGLGSGTGTGAAPVVASIAKELNALTVAIVTSPFAFEGARRIRQAEEGLEKLAGSVDTVITIPNERLLSLAPRWTSILEAFRLGHDFLRQTVQDIVEIVRNIKGGSGLPYTILVSNWSEMTEERYLELRAAGVDQFSVSLDFPDERHDEFRCLPGLYEHLSRIIPRLAKLGHDDIVLNTCITSENLHEINAAADKAREWGVNICYSAYSARRTGCRDYMLSSPEQLATLNRELDRVEKRRDQTNWIVNAPTTLDATRQYFEHAGTPGCKAGLRFLVVTADGSLQPCSMQFERFPLEQRARMITEFTSQNACDQCYVSIRSYLDKNFPQLLWENVRGFFSFKPRVAGPAEAQSVES